MKGYHTNHKVIQRIMKKYHLKRKTPKKIKKYRSYMGTVGKGEMFYGEEKTFQDFDDFKEKLEEYILWHNIERIKEDLHWKTPIQALQTYITL